MELQQLLDIVQARFGTVKGLGYFPNSKGFSLVNFDISPDITTLHGLVLDIENDTLLGGILANLGYFATHEDYSIYIERIPESSGGISVSPEGDGYVDAIASTGYGPEFQRVRQRIEPRLAEVNRLWQVRQRLAQERLELGVEAAWEAALQETGGRPNIARKPLKSTPSISLTKGMTPEEIRASAYKAVAKGEKAEKRVPAATRMQQTTARAKVALQALPKTNLR